MTATNVTPLPELLLPHDAAKAISVSEIALVRMRQSGTDPRFILVGRTCRYSRDALADGLNSETFTTVREGRAAAKIGTLAGAFANSRIPLLSKLFAVDQP